uniref:Uncharacterized protein n=1 Tax=Oryza brachyantha TaxID=4533 RepID=J3M776_ORYBR
GAWLCWRGTSITSYWSSSNPSVIQQTPEACQSCAQHWYFVLLRKLLQWSPQPLFKLTTAAARGQM